MKYIQDNPASWEALDHRENMNSGNNRRAAKCSWCNSKEHNKRTCNVLVDDIIALTKKNANYRKHFLEFCRTKGIGVGALIKVSDLWGYHAHPSEEYGAHKNALALITAVNWNEVCYPLEDNPSISCEFLSVYDYGGTNKMEGNYRIHPQSVAEQFNITTTKAYYGKLPFEVVSPGHVMIENETDWLKGTIAKKEFDRSVRGQRHRDHSWVQDKVNEIGRAHV